MKDIVFVNQFNLETINSNIMPIGLLSLCKVLKDKGYAAEIVDFNRIYVEHKLKLSREYYVNQERMGEYILKYNPCIVSVYTMANNLHTALSLCKYIKRVNKNIITVLAGPQATSVAEKILEKFPQIDLIGMGEGELTICKIVEYVKKYGLKKGNCIEGICYRKDGKIKSTYDKKHWINVDNLPLLDFPEKWFRNSNVIEMEIGRGCPFQCAYCATSEFWGRNYRVKGVERTIKEIKQYISKYKIKNFLFQHDLFTFNKGYVIALCERIIQEKLGINWACYARLDVIDEEMISMMAKAGCKKLFFGIETGSPKIQKLIGKNLDITKVIPLIKKMRCYNIKATFSFILGFPEEDDIDIDMTLFLMHRIKSDNIDLKLYKTWVEVFASKLLFFAGTKLTSRYVDYLVFDEMCLREEEHLITYPKEIIEMVKANKEIFPQYFNFSQMIDGKYRFLPSFVNSMYSSFYEKEYDCINRLIKKYDNSILKLYFDVYDKDFPMLMEIEKQINDNGEITEIMKSLLQKYQ